ncbi:MAG: hypothetical protein IPK82_27860 [Polyangiaceae bacterium]|nr:hypothetical protein [Polyangiaceae bacterium]
MSRAKTRPQGTVDPLTPAQELLVARGMSVVTKCATRHARMPGPVRMSFEELLSLGSIGLMQAVRTFRAESGTDFEVYCYKRIDGAMRYGKKKDRQFYATMWDAAYAYLETARDEGPAFDEDGKSDEAALHAFSDRLLTAVARSVCGAATMMQAATSEAAVAARDEWTQRLQILIEEIADLPDDGQQILHLVYDQGADLKRASDQLGMKYGQTRRLHERTLDDLGKRVRRRAAFDGIT